MIELLFYMAIFMILTPVLLNTSIQSMRVNQMHTSEKQINSDSRFAIERMRNMIANAKKIDTANSVFDDPAGKLTIINQDDSVSVIENNVITKQIEITENSVTGAITPSDSVVSSLSFEKVKDELNYQQLAIGVVMSLGIKSLSEYGPIQNYTNSVNLIRGDYDDDGTPDYMDKFFLLASCSGDAENDSICDEIDNCVLAYNPLQGDYDNDGIGNACDASVFFDGGNVGSGSASLGEFECGFDDYLIDLIYGIPPMPSAALRDELIRYSPLSPTVLQALVDGQEFKSIMGQSHFESVLLANIKLPDAVYQNVLLMINLNQSKKDTITAAQEAATEYAWQGDTNSDTIIYDVELSQDADKVKFLNASFPSGEVGSKKTDVFMITVTDGTGTVIVNTVTTNGSDSNTITAAGQSFTDQGGYQVTLDDINSGTYAFTLINMSNVEDDLLLEIEFDFGTGAVVTAPVSATYQTDRYAYYCPGGCIEDCFDLGSGIVITNLYVDQCYKLDNTYPEWCSQWNTFIDDDNTNPAFVGGTQIGEETVYWEKQYLVTIVQSQIDELKRIVITGEIAYQNSMEYFCDTVPVSCPMDGSLTGGQNIEMYNWDTSSWEVIGIHGLNGTISDQQNFELIDQSANLQRFLGGTDDRQIKTRMEFNWTGAAQPGNSDAPAFMWIDYFTVHLKW